MGIKLFMGGNMQEKIFVTIFLLCISFSSAQITDYNKTLPKDFNLQNYQSIDIYCTSNIVEVSEDGKLPQNTRQQYIVDKLVELFRLYIPTAKPEYGKNKLPSIYNGKMTLNTREEMNKFLKNTKSDFIFIVYNVTSSEQSYTVSSPGGYWAQHSNNKNKMSFEFWDAQKENIVFDFEIEESGNTSIEDVLFKAVDFINKREKANRQ